MTDDPNHDRSPLSPAGEVFAEFLAEIEDGATPDFDELCRVHPEIAEELRVLHARWRRFLAPPSVEAERTEELLASLREPDGDRRYEDRGPVGQGGMGEVRAAYDLKLRRTLAIKTLLQSDGPEGSRGLARFLDEARISAQLEHPGIVPVHELGLDANGRIWFSMPLIRGRDLSELFIRAQKGDPEWTRERLLSSILRVCEAVAFAHSRGVLHRDLKPANVRIGPFGETYVMDWGLAKVIREGDRQGDETVSPETWRGAVSEDSSFATRVGAVVGTPAYIAPEQAAGLTVDERVDVYSIGAMLYELLAGRKPHSAARRAGAAPASPSIGEHGPPTPLRECVNDVPPELEAICERAMASDRSDRYPGVSQLGDDLRAYLEGRVVAAYETGALAELRKWVARNRATAGAVAAAAMIAVIALAGIGWIESERRVEVEAKNDELRSAREQEALQADLARARTAEVLRLSDLGRLDDLERRADDLWPLRRDLAAPLDEWIVQARALLARGAEDHRPTLAGLRADALPYTEAQRAADESLQDGHAEREWYRQMLVDRQAELDEFIERRDGGDPSDKLLVNIERWSESVATIESLLEPLEDRSFERLTWAFATPEAQWEHDTLATLVDRLGALDAPGGLLEDVAARGAELARVAAASLEDAESAARWDAAIAALADPTATPAYGGLTIEPQFGLIPLGPDPSSGLWEFLHVQSGDEPARSPDTGHLIPSEAMGVVLILIPGGRRICGAQRTEPDRTHHDPLAQRTETPVHAVELDPYFISKYELTQAQWLRTRGTNPADLRPGRHAHETGVGADTTLLHPVETVSWSDSGETLRRLGLALPTEAQWEAAARAGTSTPWPTGAEIESLDGYVNAADRALQASGQRAIDVPVLDWLDDGWALHAPVGSFRPNPYGLHDVLGNVSEWCDDDYGPYPNPPRAGDGRRTLMIPADRVARGGGCMDGDAFLRVSARDNRHGESVEASTGVRPARALDRAD